MYGAGPRKKTAAQKAQELFTLLTGQLETEWQSLRSLNLGVKSGTGIVDELQIRKIQEWVQELHVLVVANTAAADTVAELARQLTKLQKQHLQVMLDVTGHEMLTDFIRISVYNTSNPFASVPIDGPDPAALRAARRLRGRSSGRGVATDVPKSPELRRRPPREEFLRFAGYLPQENALVQQAYSLYLNRLPTEQSGPCSEGGVPSGPSIAQRTSAQSVSQPGGQATGFELQGPSLQEEIEAERRRRLPRQPSIAMWVDVDKRWRSLNHHTQQDELLNPITVLDPIPLYVNSPARLGSPAPSTSPGRKSRQAHGQGELESQPNLLLVHGPGSRRPSKVTLTSLPQALSELSGPGRPASPGSLAGRSSPGAVHSASPGPVAGTLTSRFRPAT